MQRGAKRKASCYCDLAGWRWRTANGLNARLHTKTHTYTHIERADTAAGVGTKSLRPTETVRGLTAMDR